MSSSFRYRALTAGGATVTGSLEAASETGAIEAVRRLGHHPISATPAARERWRSLVLGFLPKPSPSPQDLAIVTRELATLLGAGLELDRALQTVASLKETGRLQAPLLSALARVRSGESLADALSHQAPFSKLYVGMVRAGESSGDLKVMLSRLADYLAKTAATRDQIVSALVYPIILLVAATFSILFILLFVLPEFQTLFADAGKKLPLATRVVIGIGDFIRRDGWLLLLLAVGGLFFARRQLRRPEVRLKLDAQALRVPILGELLLQIDVERFCRTLGTLLDSGVTLPTALGIAAKTISNSALAGATAEVAATIKEGQSLALLLARAKVFPPMTVDLIGVGEQSSKLSDMLLNQADIYERSARHKIERLIALLVPVLTVVLGAIVAALIGSMLSAILGVNDLALQ